MKLATTYLGLKLRTPLIPSASPLSEKLDNIKRMEDAGAAAVVFHSLFEEQLRPANHPMRRSSGNGGEFSSDALDDYSEPLILAEPILVCDRLRCFRRNLRFRESRHMLLCRLSAPLPQQPSLENGCDAES